MRECLTKAADPAISRIERARRRVPTAADAETRHWFRDLDRNAVWVAPADGTTDFREVSKNSHSAEVIALDLVARFVLPLAELWSAGPEEFIARLFPRSCDRVTAIRLCRVAVVRWGKFAWRSETFCEHYSRLERDERLMLWAMIEDDAARLRKKPDGRSAGSQNRRVSSDN